MSSRLSPCLRVFTVIFLIMGWGAGEAQAQPAFQVKDINTAKPRGLTSTPATQMAAVGDTLYFVGDDGGHGLELWKLDTLTGAATLVKDLFPGRYQGLTTVLMTALDDQVLFTARDGEHGHELWKSDGTADGTVMVRDFGPGEEIQITRWMTSAGGKAFFAAVDSAHGMEVWVTDGTSAGTRLLADINPGVNSSDPGLLATAGGKLLFSANNGTHGPEPWVSDGTEAGTHRVRDLRPGSAGSLPPGFFQSTDFAVGLPNGSFLIAANDGTSGAELWRTDGTEAGTALVADILPGSPGSGPEKLTLLNGKVYFSAETAAEGREIWVTDGTAAGTVLLKDIFPGNGGSNPYALTPVNGQVYFGADSALWRTDGTPAGTLEVDTLIPNAIAAVGGTAMFFTGPVLPSTVTLWRTDGTPQGTVDVQSFGVQSSLYFSISHLSVGGHLYFYIVKPGIGQSLWRSDGTTAGTVQVQLPTRTPAFPGGAHEDLLVARGDDLFFSADDGTASRFWRSDATSAGTQAIANAPTGTWIETPRRPPVVLGDNLISITQSGTLWATDGGPAVELTTTGAQPTSLTRAGGLAFFWYHHDVYGWSLWKTDGTPAGTALVKDIEPHDGPASIRPLGALGSIFLFSLETTASGEELWRSDGTEAGTFLVHERPGPEGSNPVHAITLGGTMYFRALDENGFEKLWKTDGTPAGTGLLKDVILSTVPASFTAAGSRFFFQANDNVHGWELWVSDGTAAGTRLVEDIRPGNLSSLTDAAPFIAEGNRVFFLADNGVHGRELWVSDGTEAGTRLVKDVRPGSQSLQGSFLNGAALPGKLLFLADDGFQGTDLWVTDGTEAATRRLKDLAVGPMWGESQTIELRTVDGVVLFTASDGIHGYELWMSDGTNAGTRMFQDIAPGALSSFPERITATSTHVYFIADNGTTGTELWAFPLKALHPTFSDVPSNYWAWSFIESLAAAGITTGCAPGLYCPVAQVTRAEMAIFLERGIHGGSYVPPPATGTRFTDVPASYWAAAWIEQFAADGITTGCAPSQYCPDALVNRSEMAVFLLRAKHGSSYTPPPATGAVFTDVPASYWAAAWIEQLAAEGITTGCAPNQYCPGNSVSRDQMAAFLTRTFNLTIP